MNKLLSFFKTIRFTNLLMIALVQFIVSTYFVEEFKFSFYLLITSSTICIALAAYLLNDIADLEIDKVNNKLKLINENNKSSWFKIVVALNVLGLIIGFFASVKSQTSLFAYFIAAVVLLSAYAYFFSKYKPIGNIIISLLIALSILLCFYLEINHFYFDRMYFSSSEIGVWLYAACAFLLNWLREIVKDIEDTEGDKIAERISVPIVMGVNVSKFLTGAIIFFFAIIFALGVFKSQKLSLSFYYFIVLFLYSLFVLFQLVLSQTKTDFSKLSFKIKLLMLASLLIPLIL